ncbi:MAG: glycosyltransferase family 39 protein [Chlorobiaceae bacterium]
MAEIVTGPGRKRAILWIMLALTALLYVINFQVNDIWTENESFYAESAREMSEQGNFLDINYNYEPRFNKPPLTYWMITASTALFGQSELAVRLPTVILAFATTLLVWRMALMLYDEKTALLAFAMQAISIQFIAGKQYASPEIPLAFFFTLTLYLFLKGHLEGKSIYYRLSAVALGLSVLTKGYPYIIVILGIIVLFLSFEAEFRPAELFRKVMELKPFSFILIASVIGLSWVIMMYLRYGDGFLAVLNRETIERALSRESNGWRDLLFYPEVSLWSFFPYSLVFVYALFCSIFKIRSIREITFAFSWLVVMLSIFTAAKGKIPTYFIQAHPALALISASFVSRYSPRSRFSATIWNLTFILPTVAGIVLSTAIIILFQLSPLYHLITGALLLLIATGWLPGEGWAEERSTIRALQPFMATFGALLIFSAGVLPQLEEHRPMDSIGRAINLERRIPKKIPLYVQDSLPLNLPYYAERKVISEAIPAELLGKQGPILALLQSKDLPDSIGTSVIWKGEIYRRRTSESRLLLFIESHLKARKGNMSGFTNYSLVYRK